MKQCKQICLVVYIVISDISGLDPRLLTAFVTIFEEGSVSRAAERMNITQQGLSGILVRLRAQFSDPLFVRKPHGVTPTPKAELIYPKITAAIESLQQIVEETSFIPAMIESVFRIATSDYALSVVIRPLFEQLQKVSPHLKLVVVPLNVNTLEEQMRNGQIDLALTVPEFVPDTLKSATLFSDSYQCAVRKGHKFESEEVSLDLFCNNAHLLVAPNGWNLHSPTDSILDRVGKSRTVAICVPNFLIAVSLLKKTDLLSVLPVRLLQHNSSDLHIFEPPISIPSFEIVCVWSERVNIDPLNIWFREMLRMLIGDR